MIDPLTRRLEHQPPFGTPMKSKLELLPCGVATVGADGRLTQANSAFRRLLDLPEGLSQPGSGLRELVEFLYGHGDFGGEQPDAVVRWVAAPAKRRKEWVLSGGRSVAVECLAQGQERTLVIQDATALSSTRERLRSMELSLAREKEARRQLEQEWRASEVQLHHAQKMESVGQLSGGMAHDFNNLLTVILGSLEFMETMLAQDHPCRKLIAEAEAAAERGAELTHRMLAFSRTQALQPKVINLGASVQSLAGLVQRTLGEEVEVDVQIRTTALLSKVDPGQLENCLLNLCLNSRDAMPQGGRIVIAIERPAVARAPEPPITDSGETETDASPEQILLSVTDDGEGMPPEVLDRAIDPFYTTKEVNRGSGLGLSMVYGFVKQSGGQFRIESEVGKGTRVLFTLPRWLGAQPGEEIGSEAIDQRRRPERCRILLTEDSPEVREVVQEMLARLGHEVIHADTHSAALAALTEAGNLDLLLTDIVLPGGKNGYQLANESLKHRPELKVLFMSGYQRRKTFRDSPLDRFPMLQKPFQQAELAEALSVALRVAEVS